MNKRLYLFMIIFVALSACVSYAWFLNNFDNVGNYSRVKTNNTNIAKEKVLVSIETNLGEIKLELFAKKAPATVANFLKYVENGAYEGTIFHRVIKNFMIQGGGFLENRQKVTTLSPIKNEANNGLKNLRGTIAMARTNVVDSATNQFFINLVDNTFLDFRAPDQRGYGYAVFGKVVDGMDIVDKIGTTQTQRVNAVFADMPVKPVIIKKVKRLD